MAVCTGALCYYHRRVSVLYRYIVCKGKRADCKPIEDYMFHVNEQLEQFASVTCDDDVTHVVPTDLLKADEMFYEYICRSNNT